MPIYINNFSIRVFKMPTTAPLFSMEGGQTVLNIKSDKKLFNTNASVILADPFLFVYNDTLYLFYEHLTRWFGTGRICMRSTRDLKSWTDEIEVLSEPFHLSFPNVFEENGKVYMLPETGEDKSITLYEAVDDTLSNWRKVKKLMEGGEPWYDSAIYKKDNKWYLFTGKDDNTQQVQHLFISDSLLGPYEEHPKSPIALGRDCGRNAGTIIEHHGELFRPVQVCVNSYGEQTNVMEIMAIDPLQYKEVLHKKNIINTLQKPYKYGGHQWSSVVFCGSRIVATDYRVHNYNLVELFRRIINYITK